MLVAPVYLFLSCSCKYKFFSTVFSQQYYPLSSYRLFKGLRRLVHTVRAMSGLKDVIRAADFAAQKHRTQRRKDGLDTPYINHPIGVANILIEEGDVSDPVVIQAALLHDTVEDTDASLDEIEALFGVKVRGIVDEVSDDKSLPKAERKRLQIEHAPHCSTQAKLVKLADKIYNLRDLERVPPVGWSEERVREYFLWGYKVCHGLKGTNKNLDAILEDIFKRNHVLEEVTS